MSRSRQLLPNAVTAANMFCGFYSIISAMRGDLVSAAWWIVAAAVFDLFDGRIARLLHATSEFGEYFDTLSDLLSFGVAPSVLCYQAVGIWQIPFLYLICVAFRLARFSVKTIPTQKGFFQGLSSPVSAATMATSMTFLTATRATPRNRAEALLGLSVLLGVLMVSQLRFPTFKEMKWMSPVGYSCLTIVAAAFALCVTHPSLYLFPTLGTFIIGVLAWNATAVLKKGSLRNA